jgi:predicted transcriptional regulator
MPQPENILISLSERHAENILAGTKRVELRRRSMNIDPGATAWMYVKLPVGSIIGQVTVGAIHAGSPSSLWRRFGPVSGLSRTEFFEYFSGVARGIALVLSDSKRLTRRVSLQTLRAIDGQFHPPQFFLRLRERQSLLEALGETSRVSRGTESLGFHSPREPRVRDE